MPSDTFETTLAAVGEEARRRGIGPEVWAAATAGLTPDASLLELASAQPEHTRTPGDYVGQLVSAPRIAEGQRLAAELGALLGRLEAAYGVDRHILLAIWGIESRYGVAMGERNVIRSLATLAAFDARRADLWRRELVAALRIVAAGDVTPAQIVGSWAGAMGHTQFMPSSYLAHAVDFDADGRRDIWASAADGLASAASYLKASGWKRGDPWGFEVALPAGFDLSLSAPGKANPVAFWRGRGVVPADMRWPAIAGGLELILPAGARGPAFLVTPNFRAILRYNASMVYALAVGHLADRIAGGRPIIATWPQDPPLDFAEREELQRRLVARGLDTGGIDGILGTGTRAAIRSYQRAAALPQDGYPTRELLERMRREGGP